MGLREFPLPFSAEAVARVDAFLQGLGGDGLVVLNPGGGWASKLWPAELFGQLARELRGLGLRPLVSFGPGEEGLADRVVAASRGRGRALVPDDAARLRRDRAPRAARGGGRHGAAAPRLRGRHARRGPLRAHRAGAQRALLRRTTWSCGARPPARRATAAAACATRASWTGISLDEVRAAVERRLALARA